MTVMAAKHENSKEVLTEKLPIPAVIMNFMHPP